VALMVVQGELAGAVATLVAPPASYVASAAGVPSALPTCPTMPYGCPKARVRDG